MFQTTRTRFAALALPIALLLPLGSAAPVAAGGPAVTFRVDIGSCYVSGEGPVGKQLRITLETKTGDMVASRTTLVNENGNFELPCLGRIAAGHRLIARRVNGPVLRTFRVPRVTVTLRRETDKASGAAPAGLDARLLAGPCDPSESLKEPCQHYPIQTDLVIPGNGAWSKNAAGPGFTPRGGDEAGLHLFTNQGDRVGRVDRASVVHVTDGSARVTGIANPGASVSVKFKAGSTVRGTGTGKAHAQTGFFDVIVRTPNGDPVKLALGNQVVANVAADATFTVPANLFIDTSDAINDHIMGTCYPDQPYEVQATLGDERNSVLGVAGPAGEVDVNDLVSGTSIPTGTTIRMWCETGAGDRVKLEVTLA